jgi:acetyl esterase
MNSQDSTTPYVRPDTRAFLDFLNAQEGPKMQDLPAAAGREMMRAMRAVADAEPTPLAVIRNLSCPGPAGDIPLRLYDSRETRQPGPVMVFFHGGGFVIGDLETHEPFCTEMARVLDMPVVAVDYRLAPEHPWPAAPEDCEAAARWIASNPAALQRTATGLTLSGDSAGGNLAIVVAMALRDSPADVPVVAQLPIYPATDLGSDHPSYTQFADGFLLTRAGMEWFADCYAADLAHQTASPILFDQRGMPPTLVVTASLDPIRDQGRAYVGALAHAGVPVIFREAKGNIHGFICLRKGVPSSAADIDGFLRAFRSLLDELLASA